MEKTKVISFLTKLEAEKLPPIKSSSIYDFQGKDFINVCSEEYKKLLFYIEWLLRYHFRYIFNNKTKAKFWLCYEYEKSYLWSIVDDVFINELLKLILQPVQTIDLTDFLVILYTDLCQRLKLDLEFERISFNWVLDNNVYVNLKTGEKQECDELNRIFERVREGLFCNSFVVLDKNHPTLTIDKQISFLLNKLRNIA